MAVCPTCSHSFARCEDNELPCKKCRMRVPGMSATEVRAVNDKPQCRTCGLTSTGLLNPICNSCIHFYKSQKSLPSEVFKLKGVHQLLFNDPEEDEENNDQSELVTDVLISAYTHQWEASESRLGVAPRVSESEGGLGKFKNLTKAAGVRAERKAKRADANMLERKVGIKISATVWMASGRRLQEVKLLRVSRVFPGSAKMKSALDELLELARNGFETAHPEANRLDWSNVTLHAHESATKCVSLEHLDRDKTVDYLFKEFKEQRLASEACLSSRMIDIRFVYQKELIHTDQNYTSAAIQSTAFSTAPGKRKRAESSTSELRKPASRAANASAVQPAQGTVGLASNSLGSQRRAPVVLQSAFRPPNRTQWTRNPQMIKYSFIRTRAEFQEDGDVVFTDEDAVEEIEIAGDWAKGEHECKENVNNKTGFIGMGLTKRGIYARFCGKEYVLTQPMDESMTEWEVSEILRAEYKLLSQCHGFKTFFDEFAKEHGVETIPRFYFNFANSIFGKLQPSVSSQSTIVPHNSFLATPLLPCGKVDGKVRKFTGSDDIGEALDNMTKAIHAFAHFSLLYSHGHLLFCDLQGALDAKGIMCLFDPQAHTNTPDARRRHAYWDGGPQKIEAFKTQHLPVCHDNWVCTKLELANLIVEEAEDSPVKAPNVTADKHNLNYIVA